jgi:hypothetical protein
MVEIDLEARVIIANFIFRGYFIAVTGYADCFGILETKDNNFLLFVKPTTPCASIICNSEDSQEKHS